MVVVNLTPGDHTVKWTLVGYNTLTSVITVSSTGAVSCKSVTGGSCSSSTSPGVTISGSTVTGYLKFAVKVSPCPPYGDLDGDGVIGTNDLINVQKIALGDTGYTVEQKRRAALITPGSVTMADYLLLVRYLAGTISTFPICSGTVTPTPTPTPTPSGKVSPCPPYGDINGDGVIGADDLVKVLNMALGNLGYTVEEKRRAALITPGSVTMSDYGLLLNYLAGTVTTFPICSGVVTPTPTPVPSSSICAWITALGGRTAITAYNIMTLVSAYSGATSIGFTVTASHIMGAVAYYSGNVSSGNSLTGCAFT